MISIIDAIRLKYPGIERVVYWSHQLDGTPWNNPYDGLIWENTEIPQPTIEELEQWREDPLLISDYIKQQNALTNIAILDQLDQVDLKSIRALRTNDTERLAALEIQADALRAQLLPVS